MGKVISCLSWCSQSLWDSCVSSKCQRIIILITTRLSRCNEYLETLSTVGLAAHALIGLIIQRGTFALYGTNRSGRQ